MPISADQFDRLSDPNQTEPDALAYRVMQFLRDHSEQAFRADEITAKLMGRNAKGFDIKVALANASVEGVLEDLAKQGHVETRTTDGPLGVQYYRVKR